MSLEEWIDCLELCIINLTIPETRNLTDWKNLQDLLIELKEHREREDKEDEERALEIEREDWEREE